MDITFAPGGILQVDDARIIFQNFSGQKRVYNNEGDRNFSLIIDNQEDADRLIDAGWNVKIKAPREEGDLPFMHMKVKVNYGGRRPPIIYVQSGNGPARELDEESVGILDHMDIRRIDMDIRPWDRKDQYGNFEGRTAYLHSMHVVQEVDRFAERFNRE